MNALGLRGPEVEAKEQGDLLLRNSDGAFLLLKDVLVIPEFQRSIISASKLVEKGDYKCTINKDSSRLTSKTGDIMKMEYDTEEHVWTITAQRMKYKGKGRKVGPSKNSNLLNRNVTEYVSVHCLRDKVLKPSTSIPERENTLVPWKESIGTELHRMKQDQCNQVRKNSKWVVQVKTNSEHNDKRRKQVVNQVKAKWMRDYKDKIDNMNIHQKRFTLMNVLKSLGLSREQLHKLFPQGELESSIMKHLLEEENGEERKNYHTTMNINEAHQKFGHVSEDILRRSMRYHGIKVTGELRPCPACSLYKAKARKVEKITSYPAPKPAYRLYMDRQQGPFQMLLTGDS